MPQASSVAGPRGHVAVVDDDRNMAMLLAYNLQAEGLEVSIITTGKGALEELERARPDVIILDWQLPGMSGIEILRQLGRLPMPRPPVIMLTGRASSDDKKRAMETGATAFISKPFAVSDLVQSIQAVLARA